MRTSLVFLVLVLLQQGAAQTTRAYQCQDIYGHQTKDMHCIDFDANDVPTFVKGMARMQTAYFEGAISGDQNGYSAHVQKFGLNSIQFGGMPTPTSGAAKITYASDLSSVDWTSWATGLNELHEPVAVKKNLTCAEVSLTQAEMKKQCLWQPSSGVPAMVNGWDGTLWSDPGSGDAGEQIQFCTVGLTTIASQKFTGTAQAVESVDQLYPWKNAIRFAGRDSYGFTAIVEQERLVAGTGDTAEYSKSIISVVGMANVEGSATHVYGWACDLDSSCLEQLQEGAVMQCSTVSWSLVSATGVNEVCDVSQSKEARRFPTEPISTSTVPTTTELSRCSSQYMQNGILSEPMIEYHCVDYDASQMPTAVKGTFGMRGFFSGVFKDPDTPHNAAVNYYSVDQLGAGPVGISGSAVLNYSATGAVSGPFWPIAVGDTHSHPGQWISSGCSVMDASEENMAKYCLKAGNARQLMDGSERFENGLDESLWYREDSEAEVRFCHDDFNTLAPHSIRIGDSFCSSREHCSWANGFQNRTYSQSSLRFSDGSSYGFVGVSNGPAENGVPAVQHTVLVTIAIGGEVVLQGFTCTWVPGRNTTTGCESIRLRQGFKWGRSDCDDIIHSQCKLEMTWQQLRPLKSSGQYYTGGLADLKSRHPSTAWNPLGKEYATWACIRDWDSYMTLRCGSGPGKYVCFRYDEKSEEFEFWGLNEDVRMVAPFE